MSKYLVDANLPRYFKYFHSHEFEFVSDIDTRLSDKKIWEYASEKKLIILTKDTDFYTRSISSAKPVKVIYFQLGNLTLDQLHGFFEKNWLSIKELIEVSTLLIVNFTEIKRVY